MDKFEAAGGYDADKRIANVLTGLGFKQEEWNKSCGEFSGGWQVRLLQTKLYSCMHADNTALMVRDNTALPCMEVVRACMATLHLCMLTSANGSIATCVLLQRAGRHRRLLSDNCSCSLSSDLVLVHSYSLQAPYKPSQATLSQPPFSDLLPP